MYRMSPLIVSMVAALAVARAYAQPADASKSMSAYLAGEQTLVSSQVVYNPLVRRLWISAGGGFGTFLGRGEEDRALAGQVSVHWQRGRQVLSLRAATVTYICIDENDYCGQRDVGFLIGWGTTGNAGHASIGVGIAAVPSEEEFFHTVGLPLQAQFLFAVGGVIGLGLYGFADINAEQSFGGITLSLSVGNLQ